MALFGFPARQVNCAGARRAAIVLVGAALLCVCAPGQQTLRQISGHVRPVVSSGRAAVAGAMDPDERLHLCLVLPLRDPSGLSWFLNQLYDPASPGYRRFITREEFTARFAPTPADYDAVTEFARAAGFETGARPANRLVVPVTATAAQVERAFHVRMNLYRHPSENRMFYSPDREPSVDSAISIAHIAGLNNFSLPRAMVHRASPLEAPSADASGSGAGGSYLASDMRAAYYGGGALTGAGETVALVEFDGYNRSDIDLALSSSGQSMSVPIQNVLLDGADGAPRSGDDAEPVIDIVQATGMAPGLAQVRVYIGSIDADIMNAIAAEDAAREVSISWTWSPDDPATDDVFFAEMAAQGQSVFAASGDAGEFDPLVDNFYPPEDAYVTAVGGTHLVTAGAGGTWAAETAWTLSGGGISPDGIPLPAWQAGVASAANGASTTLRNVPDVAMEADADNFSCDMGTCSAGWAGTSFAAPRWAAFTALINQQAMAAGEPAVGFLNPALYSLGQSAAYSSALHDITQGNNDAGYGCCGMAWFNAVPGYDLVTGWGSPAGQGLMDALAPRSEPAFQISASPADLTVVPGASTGAMVNITGRSEFADPVALAIDGLPVGVSASWSANPATAASTLTLTASGDAPRSASLLTISGAAGGSTASARIALEVDAPGFSIVPAKAMMLLNPGASAENAIGITKYAGFAGNVTLAVTSVLPAGVSASWINNAAGELELTADAGAAPVRTMITITGTSGGLTATATIALAIEPLPAAGISGIAPPYAAAGGAGFNITVAGSGFSVLSIVMWNGAPLTTAYATPSQITAFVPAADIAIPGVASITIGNSGAQASNPFAFEVDSAAADALAPQFSPGAATVSAGTAANYTVTISSPASEVNCLNLPAGAQCGWTQASSIVTIATAANSPRGTFQVTVVFTESNPSASATGLIVTVVLIPWLLVRRKLRRRAMRIADCICLAVIAGALIAACGGGMGSAMSVSSPSRSVTQSGVVTLTIQ